MYLSLSSFPHSPTPSSLPPFLPPSLTHSFVSPSLPPSLPHSPTPSSLPPFLPHSLTHPFFHLSVAVFVVSFLLMGFNIWAAAMIFGIVASIIVHMLGSMAMLSINANAVSLVNLVMVSGLQCVRTGASVCNSSTDPAPACLKFFTDSNSIQKSSFFKH